MVCSSMENQPHEAIAIGGAPKEHENEEIKRTRRHAQRSGRKDANQRYDRVETDLSEMRQLQTLLLS